VRRRCGPPEKRARLFPHQSPMFPEFLSRCLRSSPHLEHGVRRYHPSGQPTTKQKPGFVLRIGDVRPCASGRSVVDHTATCSPQRETVSRRYRSEPHYRASQRSTCDLGPLAVSRAVA
jgi:hypothetical protein